MTDESILLLSDNRDKVTEAFSTPLIVICDKVVPNDYKSRFLLLRNDSKVAEKIRPALHGVACEDQHYRVDDLEVLIDENLLDQDV